MGNLNPNETYLILERSNAPLKSVKENNQYILEGPLTFFGVLNGNQRMYLWETFKPHFNLLQEKIKNGSLLGDADHPESPMSAPSLKSAAIKIERLDYDKANNCINGRVKVLNTPSGQIIRNLIDDDVSISISSRALGSVKEDKTVAIERLITYDLVAEPGFAKANLTRVNESVGILNEDVAIYELPSNKVIKEDINVENETEIDTPKSPNPKTQSITSEKYIGIINSMNDNDKKEVVEILLEKVYDYIEDRIIPQIQELTENVNHLQKIPEYMYEYFGEGEDARDKLNLIPAMYEYLSNHLPAEITKVSRLVNSNINSLKKDVDGKITTLNGELSHATDYNKTIGGVKQNEIDVIALKTKTNEEKVDAVIDYLSKEIPKLQQVSEYVRVNGNYTKDLAKYLSSSSNQISDNMEDIDETLKSLKENANRNFNFEQYIQKQLPIINGLYQYVVEMKNKVNNSNRYLNNELAPKVMENLNALFGIISGELGVENYAKIMNKDETDITEQVDQILTIATKKKEQQSIQETLNFYVGQLSEEQQREYSFLDDTQRKKLVYHLNDVKPSNINELNMIWHKVVENNSLLEDKEKYLTNNMPNIIRPLYEQLDPTSQQRLLQISNNYILDTPFKVQEFWLNRTEFQSMLNKQVMESFTPGVPSEEDDYFNSLDERKQSIVRGMRAINYN